MKLRPTDLTRTNNLFTNTTRCRSALEHGSGDGRCLTLHGHRGIMGPSGSGKTTLLLMLGAMLRPTSGSVVDGIDLATAPERELPTLRSRDRKSTRLNSSH